jgi:hypothetical protein
MNKTNPLITKKMSTREAPSENTCSILLFPLPVMSSRPAAWNSTMKTAQIARK